MRVLIRERADELVRDFDLCVAEFYSADRFPHSAHYFHMRTIELRRKKSYPELLGDDEFVEKVYATLATWGLDRLGSEKRLSEFQNFKAAILKDENVKILTELASTKLCELSEDRAGISKGKLTTLYEGLRDVTVTADKLVGISKTMHHLLPDLAPPIDRSYTLNFFYERNFRMPSGKKREPQVPFNEREAYLGIFDHFRLIAEKAKLSDMSLSGKWDTSVPKLIDNAIIGFVLLKMKEQTEHRPAASAELA